MARTTLTKVKTLCIEQRQCRAAMDAKRKVLASVLKSIQTSSQRAVEIIGQLQNMNEVCLSVGNVVCSKLQHSVAVNDPESTAVAGVVAAINLATQTVTVSSTKCCEFIRAHEQFNQVAGSVLSTHKHTCDVLAAMCNTHDCAVVLHTGALEVIEAGVAVQCVICKEDAEVAYAARTGMCKTCLHDEAVNSGWVRGD